MSTNEDKQDTPAISLTAACSGSCHGPVGPAGDADAGEDTKEDIQKDTTALAGPWLLSFIMVLFRTYASGPIKNRAILPFLDTITHSRY